MPPNQRKILGPDSSVPWRLYLNPTKDCGICEENSNKKDTSKSKFYLKIGVLSHVKGSAYLEVGETKVLAAVNPPRESNKQNKKNVLGYINCELKYDRSASVNINKVAIAKNEKYLSIALKKAIEPAVCRQEFPNFQIDVIVHVLQDNGCILSSAINCAGAALIDGGVPMFDMVVASAASIHCGKMFINQILVPLSVDCKDDSIDPNEEGTTVVAQLPTCGQISESFQKGYISFSKYKDVRERLINENKNISKIVKQVLVKKVKESILKETETSE